MMKRERDLSLFGKLNTFLMLWDVSIIDTIFIFSFIYIYIYIFFLLCIFYNFFFIDMSIMDTIYIFSSYIFKSQKKKK